MTHSITLRDWPTADGVLKRLPVWVKGRVLQGKPVVLSVAEERRTLPQNAHIHACVRRICKLTGRTDEDDVRALLVEQWRHETRRPAQFRPSLDGLRMVDVSNRTSALDKADGSEFLDWLHAWEARHG